MTAEQRAAAQAVIDGPRGALYGPFVPLLHSPELMACTQRLGEYLRYRSAIGTRLTELAILVTSRQWDQQVEWAIDAPIAAGLQPDEQAVYDFCHELHSTRQVSDATWAAAMLQFGEKGVTDLMGISGYYTLLAMVMNGARSAAPPSTATPLAI
jgi:4-carboxymuconolactone decarboxylase